MIKKLDIIKDTRNVIDKDRIIHTVANFTAIEKINELVDAVNELQLSIKPILEERESEIKVHEEAQDMYDNAVLGALKDKQVNIVVEPFDPYAEQRWVGHLCKLWTGDGLVRYGILRGVALNRKKTNYPYQALSTSFEHCEPVKPDDDIIYKGGNNE